MICSHQLIWLHSNKKTSKACSGKHAEDDCPSIIRIMLRKVEGEKRPTHFYSLFVTRRLLQPRELFCGSEEAHFRNTKKKAEPPQLAIH
jgi:hypothetical protein